MSGFDYDVFLEVVLFFFATWFVARLFRMAGLPGILGGLLMGVVLGPEVLDVVPYASDGACDSLQSLAETVGRRIEEEGAGSAHGSSAHGCTGATWKGGKHIESIWTFIGNVGVTLMIMASGMHIHFEKMKVVGPRALAVAIAGTALPLASGTVVVGAFTGRYFPDGFAAGCAFAPTSVGISIRLLDEAKMLNTLAGQTTLSAAFIDDVFSLISLNIMYELAKGEVVAWRIVLQVVISFAFLGFAVVLGIYVFPHLKRLLNKIPEKKNANIQPRDEVHLFLMLAWLVLLGWLAYILIGSHLLGAFAAGMCFVNVGRSQQIWQSQLKRLLAWGIHIFFAATVGFAIPVKEMIDLDKIWKGCVLAVGPTILTKMVSGLAAYMKWGKGEAAKHKMKLSRQARRPPASPSAAPPTTARPLRRRSPRSAPPQASFATRTGYIQPVQLLVGVAMVARGEFAYLVAKEARDLDAVGFDGKMLSGSSYAMVIWALVISTIASPLLFRWALKVYARAAPVKRGTQIGGDNEKYKGHAFVIKIMGHHHIGMLREVLDMLHASGVDILEAKAESDGEFDVDVFVVQSRGNQKDFDDDKLEEMRHELQELLNDAECQITFEPLDEDFQRDGIIEIQMIGDHHQDVLHEITDAIAAMGLDVLKMHSDTVTTIDHNKKKKVEHEIFYAKETDNSKKKMITPKRRAEIRQGLMKIMHELNLHGECMVKVIHESEAQVMHTVPHFDANERVCVVKCVGKHHKEMLHEICDLFAEDFKLDVLHAEVDVKDSGDEHIFYVERTDERYPDGSAKVVDRTMRHDLREAIRKIYGTHNFKGEVSVRPHQNPGAGAPINDRLSFERLPPAVVDTNGKQRIRIANGGVRWFDETSPHWLDSTFGESNDEISAGSHRGVGAPHRLGWLHAYARPQGVDRVRLAADVAARWRRVAALDAAALAAGRQIGAAEPVGGVAIDGVGEQ